MESDGFTGSGDAPAARRGRRVRIEMPAGAIEVTVEFVFRPWFGSCTETGALLSAWLEQDLPARQQRRVGRHLLRCARCRHVYDTLCEAVGQLRAAGQQELATPVPSVAGAVVDRIRGDSP